MASPQTVRAAALRATKKPKKPRVATPRQRMKQLNRNMDYGWNLKGS